MSENQHLRPVPADQVLNDLDGGLFAEKLTRALADVALHVMEHDRAGKVQVTLDLKRGKGGHQVEISHKLMYVQPTKRGKTSEEESNITPLYVGQRGRLTFLPDTQETFSFTKEGERQG